MALEELARLDFQPRNLSKITPPRRRGDVLSRQRLLDFFTEHLDRKLILICAPAGYGKTTLLADVVHQMRIPICWYSLDVSDADPRIFLEYFIASIRRQFAGFGERTLSYLRAAGAKDLEVIVSLLLGEIHGLTEQPCLIVLDDVHTVDDQHSIQTIMNRIIPELPANWCCVVASRSVPRLRISKLVASREAAGLGDADLRFTQAEIQQLFTRHLKILVPEPMIEEIAHEAEGWIAGIILTSHALWQGLFKGWIQAKKANGPIFDYLAAEVFDNQPEHLKEFLLVTSVLDRMTPESCTTLTGTSESAEILRDLDQKNLFVVSLEGAVETYRYHALFQEFLQTRLRQTDPERYRALQRQAGELVEDEETAALNHYLLAEDHSRAADLIERVAERAISEGRLLSVLRWCARLPEDVFVERPRLQIARYQAAFDSGELDLAWSSLEKAYAASKEHGDRRTIATTLIWRCAMLRAKGRLTEAIADGRAGLAIAEEITASDLVAYGYRQLGASLLTNGVMDEAADALRRSLDGYVALNDSYNQGVICHTLGIVQKRQGDFHAAWVTFDEAIVHWQVVGNRGMQAGTLIVQGNLHYELGRLDEAVRILGEARTAATESGYLRLNGYATESLADVYRDRGEFDKAIGEYERGLVLAEQVGDRFLQIADLEGLARCYRYKGNSGLARATILRARHLASERESSFERGICEDTYGVLNLDSGEIQIAQTALEQACELLKSASVREWARAQLHYAQLLLRVGDRSRAASLAAEALTRLPGGADEPLLAVEGNRLGALLHAVGTDGPAWLAEVIERLGPAPVESDEPVEVMPVAENVSRVQCLTLGRAEVVFEGRTLAPADWPTQKARDLWFFLLTIGPSTRDQIVEALWPDADIDPSVFHTTVHRMRRALSPDCVERQGNIWRIRSDFSVSSEDRNFEESALRARQLLQTEVSDANLATALEAVALYHGRYLDGLDANWVLPTRRRLEGLYLRLLWDVIEGLRALKRHADAISQCEVYLQVSPDDERVHEAMMRSHVALGNRTAAKRHYQAYARQVREELGAEPSRRLRFLYDQLRDFPREEPKSS